MFPVTLQAQASCNSSFHLDLNKKICSTPSRLPHTGRLSDRLKNQSVQRCSLPGGPPPSTTFVARQPIDRDLINIFNSFPSDQKEQIASLASQLIDQNDLVKDLLDASPASIAVHMGLSESPPTWTPITIPTISTSSPKVVQIPNQIHPATARAYLIQKLIETGAEMTKDLEKQIADAFHRGIKYGLAQSPSTSRAYLKNSCIESDTIPDQMSQRPQNIEPLPGTGKQHNTTIPHVWNPPQFSDAERELLERETSNEIIVPMGTFWGRKLYVALCGRVICHGNGDKDLHGLCHFKLSIENKVKDITVQVLGVIQGSGTAVLLDTDSQVWAYTVRNAMDKGVPGLGVGKAVLILKSGGKGFAKRVLKFKAKYNAEIEMISCSRSED